jgi:hypothetical protein
MNSNLHLMDTTNHATESGIEWAESMDDTNLLWQLGISKRYTVLEYFPIIGSDGKTATEHTEPKFARDEVVSLRWVAMARGLVD